MAVLIKKINLLISWLKNIIYKEYGTYPNYLIIEIQNLIIEKIKFNNNNISNDIITNSIIYDNQTIILYGCVATHLIFKKYNKLFYNEKNWIDICDNLFNIDLFDNTLTSFINDLNLNQCLISNHYKKNFDNSLFNSHHDMLNYGSNLGIFQLIEHLGDGSFGNVYKGIITDLKEEKIAAIKFIKNIEEEDYLNMCMEVEFSYFSDKIGIGPKIYETFYYQKPDKKLIQIIIMEYFEMNCQDFIENNILDNNKIEIVINKIINIIKQIIFEHYLFNVDIKLQNFVINSILKEDKSYDYDVKMIDFGAHYCEYTDEYSKEEIYYILLYQLFLFLYKINNDIHINILKIFKNEFSKLNRSIFQTLIKRIDNSFFILKSYANQLDINIEQSVFYSEHLFN